MSDTVDPNRQFIEEEIERRLHATSAAHPDRPSRRGLTRAPLAPVQLSLWLSHQLDPDNPAANRPVFLYIHGPLDEDCLRRAVQFIVERQQALQTVFQIENGEPVQCVRSAGTVPWRLHDLSALASEARSSRLRQILQEESLRRFDLAQGPLLRALLVRLDPQQHVLGLFTHHIVFDGWSERILFRDLKAIYAALKENRPPALPELTIHYSDFAAWQAERLATGRLDAQIQYWKSELSDPPPPALPGRASTPVPLGDRAELHTLIIPPGLAGKVFELSRTVRLTPFMILFSAFQLLLARYGSADDILTGVPIAARTHVETEPLIGCFLNILPLRTRLQPVMTGLELLAHVRTAVLSAFTNQEAPFAFLAESLRTTGDAHRRRPLHTMFQLRNLPDSAPQEAAGLQFSFYPFDPGLLDGADLSLEIRQDAGTFHCLLRFFPDAVYLPSAAQFLEHYCNLLTALIAQPGQSIWTLPMLSASERKRILFDWNSARADYPAGACIHELFERCVDRRPEATAAVCRGEAITYAELELRANQIAHALIRRGAGPERRVVVCMDKTIQALAAIVGILKSGAAYVPIDPGLPRDRIDSIVEDVEPVAAIVDQTAVGRWSSFLLPQIALDPAWTALASESNTRPPNTAHPENLAYIMFTSGTTGKPKGVAIEHRHVVCFLHSFRPLPREALPRCASCLSPLNFDLSVEEIFSCLCFGGAVHLLHPDQFLDPFWLARYLREQGINCSYLYPDLLEPVAAELERLGGPAQLQTLITGLQPKKFRSLACWRDLAPQLRILNAYGPTEVTYGATAYEFTHALDPEADVPIGKPFPNYAVYILDQRLQPVPPGVTGEIYVGGPCVARGYWRRPEETRAAFLADPFGAQPGGRMYKTGDLGRYLPDGNIEFLGRGDSQVKLRGYRIELGEIEAVLRTHPEVADVVVSLWEPTPGDKALAAYVVARKEASPDRRALQDFLATRLPAYMIPTDWVFLDQLPRTSARKVDRRALPRPLRTPQGKADPDQEPLDAAGLKLLAIWRNLLGTDHIGPDENFFDLGGHSLSAVRMLAEIEKQFGLRLPPRCIFEAPTVRQLALRLQRAEAPSHRSALVPLRQSGSRRPLFLPHGHEGSVFLYRALVAHLSHQQPVYGLQSIAFSRMSAERVSLEQMAADLTRDIRSVQPRGPYCLAGFCIGAYLAFETACQLQTQGEEVALLAIINTPGDWRHVGSWTGSLQYHAGILRYLAPGEIPAYFLQRLRYRWNRIFDTSVYALSRLGLLPPPDRMPEYLRLSLLRDAHVRAGRDYRPRRKFRGRLLYIQGSGDAMRDPFPYWANLVDGEIHTLQVPGSGRRVLEQPNAAVLARVLEPYLNADNEPAPRLA